MVWFSCTLTLVILPSVLSPQRPRARAAHIPAATHALCPMMIVAFVGRARPGHTAAMVEVRIAAGTDAAAIAALMTQLGYPRSGDDAAARLGYWLAGPVSRVPVGQPDGLVIRGPSLPAGADPERDRQWG